MPAAKPAVFGPTGALALPAALVGALPEASALAAAAPTPEPGTDGSALDEEARGRLLDRINAHVNARVHQASDMAVYHVAELWRPSGDGPRAAGDCEDLALEKRVELLAAHFPAERLFLAVVYSFEAGLHTVLVARQDAGDVVLDSRVNYIVAWSRAPYSWLSVEEPGHPEAWRSVA